MESPFDSSRLGGAGNDRGAYELAAKSGAARLRSHDLLRRLHRSASVLREATRRVENEVRSHPDAAGPRDALALLVEVRQIGLFYEGSV